MTPVVIQQKLMRPNDYKYFETVLKAILSESDYKLRYRVALLCSEEGGGRGRSLARDNESLLKMWTRLGYFTVQDGVIMLGPRSLAEFKGYIHSEHPDIRTCDLCFSLTLMGQACSFCEMIFHKACLEKFWHSRPGKCPKCLRDWMTG